MDKFQEPGAESDANDETEVGRASAKRGRVSLDLPLHQQVADALRRQIATGALRPGDQLPSEHDLMRQFGVSRGTVRLARSALRASGAIGGSRGRRLSVRGAPLTQPLGELVSFTAWIRSFGKEPGGEVIAFGPELATVADTAAIGVKAGERVWRLKRVRSVDREPLLIERTVFVDGAGAMLEGVDLAANSVYEQFSLRGLTVATACHLIDAMPASAADALYLGIAPGSTLLRVQRHGFDPDGQPVEWSDDRYRADRVNFAIENTVGKTALVRQFTPDTER